MDVRRPEPIRSADRERDRAARTQRAHRLVALEALQQATPQLHVLLAPGTRHRAPKLGLNLLLDLQHELVLLDLVGLELGDGVRREIRQLTAAGTVLQLLAALAQPLANQGLHLLLDGELRLEHDGRGHHHGLELLLDRGGLGGHLGGDLGLALSDHVVAVASNAPHEHELAGVVATLGIALERVAHATIAGEEAADIPNEGRPLGQVIPRLLLRLGLGVAVGLVLTEHRTDDRTHGPHEAGGFDPLEVREGLELQLLEVRRTVLVGREVLDPDATIVHDLDRHRADLLGLTPRDVVVIHAVDRVDGEGIVALDATVREDPSDDRHAVHLLVHLDHYHRGPVQAQGQEGPPLGDGRRVPVGPAPGFDGDPLPLQRRSLPQPGDPRGLAPYEESNIGLLRAGVTVPGRGAADVLIIELRRHDFLR